MYLDEHFDALLLPLCELRGDRGDLLKRELDRLGGLGLRRLRRCSRRFLRRGHLPRWDAFGGLLPSC